MKYRLAALGGTFDRLHQGHEQLIRSALAAADNVVIGIADVTLTQEKTLSAIIEPYERREKSVHEVLKRFGADGRATVMPLTDPYGPTLTDNRIDVLVVSRKTAAGGTQINEKRIQRGLSPLPIIEASMVCDETGHYLSSTHIRLGLSVRSGRSFPKLFDNDIRFSRHSLTRLRQPQGNVMNGAGMTMDFLKEFTAVALIGDIVTKLFIDRHLPFKLAIVDGQTRRGERVPVPRQARVLAGFNEPGTINAGVARQIVTECGNSQVSGTVIQVSGEEDLLAFVPALTLPLGSAVLYGQPDEGIVMITLSEAEKVRLARFIDPTFS